MKSFLELVEETKQGEKHHAMTFGRMNPPTTGHLKLINKVKDVAAKHNASHSVVVSHSQDSKKNPLTGPQKLKHLKRYSPDTHFKTSSKEHPSVLFVDTAIVEVKTLDSFNIASCNFLNMDVQGYELNVLKGGVDTLKHIDAVYTEVNTAELYTNNPLIEEMDEWLKEKGFIRVWTHITPNHWGDALYVKQ
jgi:FkbM family methyltransferase